MSEILRSPDWPGAKPPPPKRRYEVQYWSRARRGWRTWSTHRTLFGAKLEYSLTSVSDFSTRRVVDHGKDWRQSGEV